MIVSKYVARQMVARGRGGSIVSISSIAAMVAPAAMAAYVASKAGTQALNASPADEPGPHGITCNVVAPGFLDTDRIDALPTDEKWEKRLSTIPIKRAGTVEEVDQRRGGRRCRRRAEESRAMSWRNACSALDNPG